MLQCLCGCSSDCESSLDFNGENIDPLLQQLDKRHFWSFEISPIEKFDDIYSGLLTLSDNPTKLKIGHYVEYLVFFNGKYRLLKNIH